MSRTEGAYTSPPPRWSQRAPLTATERDEAALHRAESIDAERELADEIRRDER